MSEEFVSKDASTIEEACCALLAKPAFSRRAFFSLAAVAGALHMIGTAAGGRVIAYADEVGATHFVIVILSKEEIAVFAVDLATKGYTAVPDVNIKLTSHYNNKVLTGKTEKDGIAIFNVKALSPQHAEENPKRVEFFLACETTVKGFREFAFTKQLVQAGPQATGLAHIFLTTQPYKETEGAYLRMACFDGNDMIYREANMPKYPNNTIDHTVQFQVVTKPNNTVTCEFLGNDVIIGGPLTATADANGYAYFERTGPYVKTQAIGTVFKCHFQATGEKKKSLTLRLAITDPAGTSDGAYNSDKWQLCVGMGAGQDPKEKKEGEKEDFKLPSVRARKVTLPHAPWGNIEVTADLPWLPLTIIQDPRGMIGMAIKPAKFTLFTKGYGSKMEKFDRETWLKTMESPCRNFACNFLDDMCKSLDRFDEAGRPENTWHGLGAKFLGSVSLNMDFEAGLLAEVNRDGLIIKKNQIQGRSFAAVAATLGAEFGFQIAAGPLPVLAVLDITLFTRLQAEAGMRGTPLLAELTWYCSMLTGEKRAFIINIFFTGGFSVGIGLKGICSMTVRAYYSINLNFTFEDVKDKPFPHKEITHSAGLQLCMQLFFFVIRVDVFPFIRKNKILDNWDTKKKLDEQAEFNDFYQDPAFGDFDQVYVTEEDLVPSAEVTCELSDQGVFYNFDLSDLALPDAEAMLEQGMQNPYETNNSYDARKGMRPLIETAFVSKGEATAKNVYSDNRVKIVQLGNTLFICRIVTVKVSTQSNDRLNAMTQGDFASGNTFFVRKSGKTLPHLEYNAPTGEQNFGTFTLSEEYDDLPIYKGDAAQQPIISHVDVPIYGVYSDEENALEANGLSNSAQSIDDRMKELAVALGWVDPQGAPEEDDSAGLVDATNYSPNRTRVVVTPFDMNTRTFGTSDILDFTVASQKLFTLRCDMNDVDFNAVPDTQSNSILFGIVSTTRSKKRDTEIEDMKESTFTSVLRYIPASTATGHGRTCDAYSNIQSKLSNNHYEWKAIPFAVHRFVDGSRRHYIGVSATGKRGLRNVVVNHFFPFGSTNNTSAEVVIREANFGQNPNEQILAPDNNHMINDDGILQTFVQPSTSGGSDALIVCWQHNDAYYTKAEKSGPMKPDKERATVWSLGTADGGSLLHAAYDFKRANNFTTLGPDKGFAWVEHNNNNTEVKLYNVRIAADGTLQDYDKPVCLGYSDSGTFFATGNGNMLYTFRLQEGSEPAADAETQEQIARLREEGAPVYRNESGFCAVDAEDYLDFVADGTQPSKDVKLYQVIAARWDPLHKRYRTFFPYAQLASAPDEGSAYPLAQVGSNLGGTVVVYSTITNARRQQSKMIYTEIDSLVNLTFNCAACFDSFIGEGTWTIHPQVQVTNNGNMPIRGFTVTFTVPGTDFEKVVTIDHLEKHVLEPLKPVHEDEVKQKMQAAGIEEDMMNGDDYFSFSDPSNDEPWSAEDEALLWPGSVRDYQIPVTIDVDLKKGWKKKTTVNVAVSNPVPPTATNSLSSVGEDLSEVMFENEGIYQVMCGFDGRDKDSYFNLTFGEAELNIDEEYQPNYIDQAAPKTGDTTSAVAVAGVAAVAAGATAVAKKVMDSKEEAAEN